MKIKNQSSFPSKYRLFILIAVCVLSCLGLAFKEPLFRFILAPAEPDFPMYRLMGADFDMKLINVDIAGSNSVRNHACHGRVSAANRFCSQVRTAKTANISMILAQ